MLARGLCPRLAAVRARHERASALVAAIRQSDLSAVQRALAEEPALAGTRCARTGEQPALVAAAHAAGGGAALKVARAVRRAVAALERDSAPGNGGGGSKFRPEAGLSGASTPGAGPTASPLSAGAVRAVACGGTCGDAQPPTGARLGEARPQGGALRDPAARGGGGDGCSSQGGGAAECLAGGLVGLLLGGGSDALPVSGSVGDGDGAGWGGRSAAFAHMGGGREGVRVAPAATATATAATAEGSSAEDLAAWAERELRTMLRVPPDGGIVQATPCPATAAARRATGGPGWAVQS